MIVPMKKIYIVLQKKDAVKALNVLGNLGVLHIEHEMTPSGPPLEELRYDNQLLTKVINVLNNYPETQETKQTLPSTQWKSVAQEVLGQAAIVTQLKEDMAKRQTMIEELLPWGHFSLEDIRMLTEKGVYVFLGEADKNDLAKLPEGVIVKTISQSGKKIRLVVISDKRIELPFPILPLPPMSLNEMQVLQGQDQKKLQTALDRLNELSAYQRSFEEILKEKMMELSFQEALAGMGEAQEIVFLKGYSPSENCSKIIQTAAKEHWALLIEDPTTEDNVPTLLKNPKWIRLIEPLYQMMNIIPGYRELDISPFFLIFFSIFFGLLVGDAGYGAIIMLATLIAHWKLGGRLPDKTIFYLNYVLSSVTIIWGLLTGTVFGTILLSQVFKPMLPWLTDIKNLQLLCFILGAVHLTISHAWRLINKITRPFGILGEIGWICLLWVSFFLAKAMILGEPFPSFIKMMVGIGIGLVVVEIIAQRQDVAVNLMLLIFSIISAFTDVVSYIRLFAVGLAGVSVGDAFNRMALDIGFHNPLAAIAATLILIFVHLFLNIALAILGVLVHGIRLNMLEFSTHLNMEWSGTKYNPFRSYVRTVS